MPLLQVTLRVFREALFVYGSAGSSLLLGLSVVASGGYSSVVHGLLIAVTFSCCGAQALGLWASAVAAHRLWSTASGAAAPGLVVPRHVESSQIGDRTCVSCTGGWILC